MKKSILFLSLFSTVAAAAFSQATKQATANPVNVSAHQKADSVKAAAATVDTSGQKLYVLQGSVEAFQALIQALDQSSASHLQVEALKQWIIPSINKQLPPAASK